MKTKSLLITTPQLTIYNIERKDAKKIAELPTFVINKVDLATGKVHQFLFVVAVREGVDLSAYDPRTMAKNAMEEIVERIVSWGDTCGYTFQFQTKLTDEQKAQLAENANNQPKPLGYLAAGPAGAFPHQASIAARNGAGITEFASLTEQLDYRIRNNAESGRANQCFSIRGMAGDNGVVMTFPIGHGMLISMVEFMDGEQIPAPFGIQLAGKQYRLDVARMSAQNIGEGENQFKLIDVNHADLQVRVSQALLTYAPYLVVTPTDGRLLLWGKSELFPKEAKKAKTSKTRPVAKTARSK